ncbi:Lrp/AsnC family transcriptional regulator [Candidatus Woesearchaeota archaeon]|nr:Lrp/AsnC family transcriptional regulator [Candidatus Woesearchaeota archaeon]
MDKKDESIIQILKENSNLSTQQISKKTLIPITTVHNRIKKLKKEGIIRKYTVELDSTKVGKNIAAYINIVVDYKFLKEKNMSQYDLAKKLKQQGCVEACAMVTGGTDIIITLRVGSIEELDNFVTKDLRNIDGIEKTQTMVILNEV